MRCSYPSMLITPRRCPATSLLSCDFSNQEKSAAATLRTPAAAVSERSRRTTPRRPRTAAARRRAPAEQGGGNDGHALGAQSAVLDVGAIPAADRCLFCRAELLPNGGPGVGRCLRSVRHRATSDRIPRRRSSRGGGVRGLADRIAGSLQEQAAAGSPEEYQRLAADNQELGNTFDQQERTLVSSLSG